MTQLATPETVIGDFDTKLSLPGFSFDLRRDGDDFYFDVEEVVDTPAGPRFVRSPDYQIVMTTGSHHMQVCWYSMGDDTRVLGILPFMYLKRDRRWVPLNSTFMNPPEGFRNENGRWNSVCIKCHVTQGRVNVGGADDDELGLYLDLNVDTRVGEFGISCEACHGPGEQHVQTRQSNGPDDAITHPKKLSHRLSSQICGQCHGRFEIRESKLAAWQTRGFEYRPGQDLETSSMRLSVRCRGDSVSEFPESWKHSFWSDGMVRVSSIEYNGLIESPCFERGELSCISCHQMHQSADDQRSAQQWANDQLGEGMEGNQACTQCHREYREAEGLARHTHHPVESSGSNCYNCHMPYTTYGLLKAIRSHQIHSPDVAVSVKTGRPNACNQCHLDKTLAWSAEHLSDWYGIDVPELTDDQQSVAASALWLLRGDAGQRALMAWNFGWDDAQAASGSAWMPPYLGQLLVNPYDAVRYIAGHSLRKLPGFESFEYDFIGDPRFRSAASQQVLERWSGERHAISENRGRTVLVNESGQLLTDRFNRLLEQRDDRPVILNE